MKLALFVKSTPTQLEFEQAQMLKEKNWIYKDINVLEFHYTAFQPEIDQVFHKLDDFDYILINSQNSLISLEKSKQIEKLRNKEIKVVGKKTFDYLQKQQIQSQMYTNQNDLYNSLQKEIRYLQLIGNLSEISNEQQLNIKTLQVYENRTISEQKFLEQIKDITEKIQAIVYFSGSNVEYIQKNFQQIQNQKDIFHIFLGQKCFETFQKFPIYSTQDQSKLLMSKKSNLDDIIQILYQLD